MKSSIHVNVGGLINSVNFENKVLKTFVPEFDANNQYINDVYLSAAGVRLCSGSRFQYYVEISINNITVEITKNIDSLEYDNFNDLEYDTHNYSTKLKQVILLVLENCVQELVDNCTIDDYFQNLEQLPPHVKKIVEFYENLYTEGIWDYATTKNYLQELTVFGFTFEYGLDNEPYDLQIENIKLIYKQPKKINIILKDKFNGKLYECLNCKVSKQTIELIIKFWGSEDRDTNLIPFIKNILKDRGTPCTVVPYQTIEI